MVLYRKSVEELSVSSMKSEVKFSRSARKERQTAQQLTWFDLESIHSDEKSDAASAMLIRKLGVCSSCMMQMVSEGGGKKNFQ